MDGKLKLQADYTATNLTQSPLICNDLSSAMRSDVISLPKHFSHYWTREKAEEN